MQTTMAKIVKTIAVEVAKSAGLVILSSLVSQALRQSVQGASESMAQSIKFAKNKILDFKEKAA
jgi:hypothetical protein